MKNPPSHELSSTLLSLPFAHRGLFQNTGHGDHAPENSLSAFLAARDAGFGIELDVALTACGRVVAFHDDDFLRLCGVSATVKETSFEDMRTFRILGSREGIPLLADVLCAVNGKVPIVIELKAFDAWAGFHNNGLLEKACLELCATYAGPHAFKSFNPGSVGRLKEGGARGPVGFLSCNYSKDGDFPFLSPEDARSHSALTSSEALSADFISYGLADLTPAHKATMKATRVQSGPAQGQERPLLVWTVRTEADFAKAQGLADNIIFEWRGVRPVPFQAP